MAKILAQVARDTSGATAIEYALILSILSVSVIAAVRLLAGTLNTMLNSVSALL